MSVNYSGQDYIDKIVDKVHVSMNVTLFPGHSERVFEKIRVDFDEDIALTFKIGCWPWGSAATPPGNGCGPGVAPKAIICCCGVEPGPGCCMKVLDVPSFGGTGLPKTLLGPFDILIVAIEGPALALVPRCDSSPFGPWIVVCILDATG